MKELPQIAAARELATAMPGLRLRELRVEDAAEYHDVVQRNAQHLTRSGDYYEEVAATVTDVAEAFARPASPPVRFGIRQDGALVGRVDLNPVAPPKYGIGYWLAQDASGRGLGTTAVAALIEYARNSLAASDVLAGVSHHNDQSVALLRRLGFDVAQDFEKYTRFRLSLTANGRGDGPSGSTPTWI